MTPCLLVTSRLRRTRTAMARPRSGRMPVFEAEVPADSGRDPQHLAELMFKIGNAPPEYLSNRELEMAGRYRSRGLRSLSFPWNRLYLDVGDGRPGEGG